MKHLLALDWGSSSLRGAWLDAAGQVLEERAFARGILSVAPGEFPCVFETCFGDWMKTPGALCLMSGMVGSQQGWLQAPYCACPAGFADVARRLAWVEPGRVAIVPGLSCEQEGIADVKRLERIPDVKRLERIPDVKRLERIPDVMRGEETQVFGALRLLGLQDALLVLPGTHSKWVRVQGGRVQSFATFMTGEFYALLRQHSILSRSLPAGDEEFDSAAFEQGVALALRGGGLLHTAFSTRTLALFERLPAAALPSYLSGLLIGEELRAQSLAAGTSAVVIGAAALTQRYRAALALQGVAAQCVGAQAAWAGLWAIAQTIPPRLLRTS